MIGAKKNRRIWPIVLIVFIILAVLGYLYWNSIKYRLIRTEATDQVFEKSKGLYRMHYDNLNLDEVSGFLQVTNLRLTPDTSMFSKSIADKTNQPFIFEIIIPELTVRGVKTPEAMLNKNIEGRRLEIKNPQITAYYSSAEKDSTQYGRQREIYEQLLGNLNLIRVDSIDISNANIRMLDFNQGREMVKADSISIHLLDVFIDSTHQSDSSRFYFARKTAVQIKKISWQAKNKTYDFAINNLDFNTDAKTFSIKSFILDPLLSEKDYAKLAKVQKDRLNIRCGNIDVEGIDIAALQRGEFTANQMKLGSIMLHLSKDLSYPHDGKNRVGTYPQQALMKVPFPLYIKRLIAGPADIEVKQKNPKSDESGKLQFRESSIDAVNVTNMPELIKNNNHLKVSARTKFMGLSQVNAEFDLLLKDKAGRFGLKGTASGFDARGLNVVLEPLGLAKIEEAKVNQLRFNLKCSDYSGTGTVVLLYENLKIAALKKDSVEQKLEKKKLASFISNIILKDANPAKGKDVRMAHPVFERDPVKSFWNLIWFTLFTGVKETVGMEKNVKDAPKTESKRKK
ncbi:hypothetical protein [Pollutibacter soli]|uniref:hypothetical protein n=1 Tax=Pollutibacter soli TaxID=3034157 RepID=UPI00301357E9